MSQANTITTLTAAERVAIRKELLRAGIQCSQLSDSELEAAVEELRNPTPAGPVINQVVQGTGLTQEQVVSVVDQRLAERAPVAIQVTRPDQSTVTIDGAHAALESLLRLLKIAPIVQRWPYLVGPAGSGKTTLGNQAAEALGLPFYCTEAVAEKFEQTGHMDANSNYHESALYQCMKHGGVFLWDELPQSAPDAVAAFNMVLANGWFTFPNGERVERHEDCYFIAGGNTFGDGVDMRYAAAGLLDGSTRDRFNKLEVGYDAQLELRLAMGDAQAVNPDVSPALIEGWHGLVLKARAFCDEQGLEAIVSPRATRAGAAMLADGWNVSDVIQMTLSGSLTEQQLKQAGLV